MCFQGGFAMSENKSSASIAENLALAKEKRGFPFKKVFFALLILLLVCSAILFVVNLIINSYFKKGKYDDSIRHSCPFKNCY